MLQEKIKLLQIEQILDRLSNIKKLSENKNYSSLCVSNNVKQLQHKKTQLAHAHRKTQNG